MVSAPWLEVAIGEVGIRELDGIASHPRIAEYLATALALTFARICISLEIA